MVMLFHPSECHQRLTPKSLGTEDRPPSSLGPDAMPSSPKLRTTVLPRISDPADDHGRTEAMVGLPLLQLLHLPHPAAQGKSGFGAFVTSESH